MGQNQNLEVRARNDFARRMDRRDFLKLAGVSLAGSVAGILDPDFENHLAQILSMANPSACAPIASFQSDPRYKDYIADLNPVLKNELKVKRDSQNLISVFGPGGGGRRADYSQHLRRLVVRPWPGLDIAPIGDPTEIVPAASGYVYNIIPDNEFGGGMILQIMHPFGYRSNYLHLDARYVDKRIEVKRRDVIADMGATGEGAVGITHLHFNIVGPEYSKFLKGVEMYHNVVGEFIPDPEDFSIAGKGSKLPYQRQEDKSYDEALWKMHFDAQKYMEPVMREFPKGQVKVKSDLAKQRLVEEFGIRKLEEEFGIRAIDKDIEFTVSSILDGKHPFSKGGAEKIVAQLSTYMQRVPRLTAPIKEPARANDYNYLPFEKIPYKKMR